jgi:hypothetical protein
LQGALTVISSFLFRLRRRQGGIFQQSVTNFRDTGVLVAASAMVTSRASKKAACIPAVRQLVQRCCARCAPSGGKEQERAGKRKTGLAHGDAHLHGDDHLCQIVMRSVIEEKSSRVIESVISSICLT